MYFDHHWRNGFILYKPYYTFIILYNRLPYTYPTPKPTPYRKLCAFLLSQKNESWVIYKLFELGDTENVLINHLLLVIPMSYPCHYTNLCPHKPYRHAHTHTHSHIHIIFYFFLYFFITFKDSYSVFVLFFWNLCHNNNNNNNNNYYYYYQSPSWRTLIIESQDGDMIVAPISVSHKSNTSTAMEILESYCIMKLYISFHVFTPFLHTLSFFLESCSADFFVLLSWGCDW